MKNFPIQLRQKFWALTSRLSPENLACDGEISQAEVRRRHKQIMKEWAALEAEAGRKVTEEEAESDWVDHLREGRQK